MDAKGAELISNRRKKKRFEISFGDRKIYHAASLFSVTLDGAFAHKDQLGVAAEGSCVFDLEVDWLIRCDKVEDLRRKVDLKVTGTAVRAPVQSVRILEARQSIHSCATCCQICNGGPPAYWVFSILDLKATLLAPVERTRFF